MTAPGKTGNTCPVAFCREGRLVWAVVSTVETISPERAWRAGLGRTAVLTGAGNRGVLLTFLSVQLARAGQSPPRELSSSTIHPNPGSSSESF